MCTCSQVISKKLWFGGHKSLSHSIWIRIQSSFIYRRSLMTYRTNHPQSKVKMMINKWMTDLCLISLKHIFLDLIWLWYFLCCSTESMLYLDGKRHFNQTVGHWMQHFCCLKPYQKHIQFIYVSSFNKVYILLTPCSVYTLITWWPGSVTLFLLFFNHNWIWKLWHPVGKQCGFTSSEPTRVITSSIYAWYYVILFFILYIHQCRLYAQNTFWIWPVLWICLSREKCLVIFLS